MSACDQLKAINQQLEAAVRAKSAFASIKPLTNKAKLFVYDLDGTQPQPDLIAQCILFSQLNVLASLLSNNTREIERAVSEARFFYENHPESLQSSNYSIITAIHLLFLLSSHQNAEFYMKLESLRNVDLESVNVSFVLRLSDAIQEGNYRKVFALRKEAPSEYFAPFLNSILETVRTEIAKSAQIAYQSITLKEAMSLFQFDNERDLLQFITKCQEPGSQDSNVVWSVSEGKILFNKTITEKLDFNSDQLIETMLHYTFELERIA